MRIAIVYTTTLPPRLFELHPSSGVPIYRQLVDQVRALVAGGKLRPGDLLPSVRQVAQAAEINPMTVSKAYSRLEVEGLVERVRGQGMRVRTPAVAGRVADRKEEFAELSPGAPPRPAARPHARSDPQRARRRCSPNSKPSPPPTGIATMNHPVFRVDNLRKTFAQSAQGGAPRRRPRRRTRHGPRPVGPERQRQEHAHQVRPRPVPRHRRPASPSWAMTPGTSRPTRKPASATSPRRWSATPGCASARRSPTRPRFTPRGTTRWSTTSAAAGACRWKTASARSRSASSKPSASCWPWATSPSC